MPLKSLKDKIASVAGGELLGDTNVYDESDRGEDKKETTKGRKRKPREKSKTKVKKKEKAKVETKRRPSMFNLKKEEF